MQLSSSTFIIMTVCIHVHVHKHTVGLSEVGWVDILLGNDGSLKEPWP